MSSGRVRVRRCHSGTWYEIDNDRARLDRALIRGFLAQSHWARGLARSVLDRALRHSLAFGVYRGGRQVGFARVVTDYATIAYVTDVFILPAERRKGLARWLMETMLSLRELQGLRRWLLGTREAHGLYRGCGFTEPPPPFAFLERRDRAVSERGESGAEPQAAPPDSAMSTSISLPIMRTR